MQPSTVRGDQHSIIGRNRERKRLRSLLDTTLTGRGALVLLSGEAGIGKTTLIEALAREADEQGALVLTGGCYDLTTTPPYGPWVELLRAYPATTGLPAPLDVLHETDGIEQIASQEQLFRSLADFFGDVAVATPLVLILEDFHWADLASIELLRYLARQLSRMPILIVASYRDDELPRSHPLFVILPLLVREARAERLELQPFDGEALRAFVEHQYSLSSDDTHALASYLLQHTEGNPLFIAELLRSLEREQILAEGERGWRLGELDQIVPPPLVAKIIERHLASIDPTTRDALNIAALIGQDISLDLWHEISGLDEETLSAVIEEALVARIIEPQGRAGLRFRHALIREVLYQGMLFPRRRRIHREAAETLVAAGSPDADAVAFHFQQAGDERAIEWLIRAGERAQSAYAHAVAAERFETALHLYGDDPATGRERAWLAWSVSRMLAWADARKQRHYLELAAQLAQQAGERSLLALCSMYQGIWHCGNGNGRRGIQEIEHGGRLWDSLTETERTEAFPRILARGSIIALDPHHLANTDLMSRLARIYPGRGMLSSWLAYTGRFAESIAVAEELIAEANEAGVPSDLHVITCSGGYAGKAVAYAALGNPDKSHAMYELTRESSRRRNAHVPRLFGAGMQFWFLTLPYFTDDLTERRALMSTATDAVTRIDRAFPSMVSGMPWFEVVDGNWHEAKALLHEYLKRPVGWGWRLPFLSLACWLERHTGEAEVAWSRIHESLPAGPRTEPGDEQFMFITPLLRRAVELSLDAGDLGRAHEWLQAHDNWLGWAGAFTGQAQSRLLWARYLLQCGDPAAARREAERAMHIASEPRQLLSLLAGHRFLGELDILKRRFGEAERNLKQSLQLADASTISYERAQSLLSMTKLCAARGDATAARRLLDEVRLICQPLGAALVLTQAAQIERQLTGASFPAGLSAREAQVLQLIAEGLSDAEIAARLSISPRTVNRHTTSIYNKLGINSRVAATRFAVDHHLV